jgi:hypothetical protein
VPPVCDTIDCGTGPRRSRDPDPVRQSSSIGICQGQAASQSPIATPPPPNPAQQPRRRRRLVNAVTPQHLLSSAPYRDALMAGRGRHVCRRGIGGRSPQVGGRGTAATQLLAPAAMVRHRRLIVVGEPWRRVVAGLTPSPRRLLGLMRQTVPGVRGLGLAVAAMGGPGVAVRNLLINHVGNAATTLQQTSVITSLPRRLCRLLRTAKGSASALWSALFALMTTSPTNVRFSVVRSRRSPIVLPLMTMEVFSYPGN